MAKSISQKKASPETGLPEELLRYVMPCNQFKATLQNGKIQQTYKRINLNPMKITISEKIKINPSLSYKVFYILKENHGDLILRTLTEFLPQGGRVEYETGYPYIRFPKENVPCHWSYDFCDIIVNCTSEFAPIHIKGKEFDALIVKRVYGDADSENRVVETECYVAGFGIVSKERN